MAEGLSDINVTPLVDVMLVLLVVFVVTTPIIVEEMQQRKVEIDLPTTNAAPVKPSELQTIVVLQGFRVTLDLGQGESELVNCSAQHRVPSRHAWPPGAAHQEQQAAAGRSPSLSHG